MLDLLAIAEVEARNPRAPELEAGALGLYNLERGTVESILEMYSQRPKGEWGGGAHYAAEYSSMFCECFSRVVSSMQS